MNTDINNPFPAVGKGQIGGQLVQTVNARELHAFLKVHTRFNDWINNRIREFGFVENQDYVSLTENLVSGGSRKEYYITLDMGKELGMVERTPKGKEVRQHFIECEQQLKLGTAIPTTAEAFASAFQMIANAERTQTQQAKAISRLEQQVERVEIAQTVLRQRPSNAEGITHIRSRIGRLYGLSANVIDEVMRQSPYAPKPAGMVRNDHGDADGSLYAVFWQKDITKTFDRFVDECKPDTAFLFTHPFIEGRFRVARKPVVA
ncbi:hypothetical protein C5748_18455 [Phyllobacterium phragmitis]|uniref:AntA/AntB antirepressor domain-containing protein n=1 Tax=Phyllobacterium phragmitis TaxID=2670329 RepID=A0A2S9INN7_9HYPH|nr:antA/AntB antirepressor family protein [Phyllobacterium phragmitis]PRD42131.1 hypothetical protein C5748_18455 [Phyllobacterium phragmitis]